jgi:YfiH family protein
MDFTMIENSKTMEVEYGKIHSFTLGKEAWDLTFPNSNHFPTDFASWQAAINIIVSKFTHIPSDQIISIDQEHKSDIGFIENSKISHWLPDYVTNPSDISNLPLTNPNKMNGDGLVTFQPNTALVIRTADCVPIFCYSKIRPMVALIHAGWRGALNGISEKLIHWLLGIGFTEEELQVFVGPAISKKNYLVQWDVAQHFMAMPPGVVVEAPGMGYLLGVKEAILVRLRKEFSHLSMDPQNSEVFLSPKYFSHRSKDLGRNINVIFWES